MTSIFGEYQLLNQACIQSCVIPESPPRGNSFDLRLLRMSILDVQIWPDWARLSALEWDKLEDVFAVHEKLAVDVEGA